MPETAVPTEMRIYIEEQKMLTPQKQSEFIVHSDTV